MKRFYICTPVDPDEKKAIALAKRAANWFRLSGISFSPILTFGYLDRGDWLYESHCKDLLQVCTDVYVFADEVTELMIAEIKEAQRLGLPVHFYDTDLHEINYDALVINKRIGPGYRKIICEAHGDSCCPCCGELREKHNAPEAKAADKPAEPATVAASSGLEKKAGLVGRLFGKAR